MTAREQRRGWAEMELGVPIPGEVLPEDQWTKTDLKQISPGLISWKGLFGREAPIVLDLGCGNGRYLLGSALWRPDHDHLGVDSLAVVIRYATRRGNQRGLKNLRFAVRDAHELLVEHTPPGSVSEIHCYHPQPYYDKREYSQRLITPEFLALVIRALKPEGKFFLQTDNPSYWWYMKQSVAHFFDFQDQKTTWPDAPRGRTRREIIALRENLPVFRGWGTPLPEMTWEKAMEIAPGLPLPTFNADRSTERLDRLERKADR